MKTFENKSNHPHNYYGVNAQPATPITNSSMKFPSSDSKKSETSPTKPLTERKNKSVKHLPLPPTEVSNYFNGIPSVN